MHVINKPNPNMRHNQLTMMIYCLNFDFMKNKTMLIVDTCWSNVWIHLKQIFIRITNSERDSIDGLFFRKPTMQIIMQQIWSRAEQNLNLR